MAISTHSRTRRGPRFGRWLTLVALAALIGIGGCGPSPEVSGSRPSADGWYEFQGSWIAAGSRHRISLGADRRASVVDLSGSLLLAGPSRPDVGFRGDAIALNDSATGMIGRAVWTDEKGEQVFSELRGEGTATGNHIRGTFVGGTGRYSGATGTYEFAWQYVLEAEDGTVQGRAVGLTGRIHVEPSPVVPAPKEAPR